MTIEDIIISSIITYVIIVLVVFLYPKDDDNKRCRKSKKFKSGKGNSIVWHDLRKNTEDEPVE